MKSNIRKGEHDTLVDSTLGPIEHHPVKVVKVVKVVKETSHPAIKDAIPFDTVTKEELSFTAMQQSNHDPTFFSNGIQRNPILIGEKQEAHLTRFDMKYTEELIGVNELDGQLCVDPTNAFLMPTTYTDQLPHKFEQKCVYTITKQSEHGLEYLLTDAAKERPLRELNDIFHCCRIDDGVPTRVTFNELNRENYHWLQLDRICMSVFFACIKWKVAPLHPMSRPVLVINADGRSFIPAIRGDGTYYRRNHFSNLVMTVINGVRTLVNNRG